MSMKTTAKQPDVSQATGSKASKQSPVGSILQAYKKSANQTVTPTIQCMWPFSKNTIDTFKALYPFGLSEGPLESDRSQLEDVSSQSTSFFGSSVNMVNRNMGTRTDADLPSMKKQEYMRNIPLVDSGKMSNSYAFASSAYNWMIKEGNFPAAGLNFLGFLGSGPIDHINHKMGRLE